MKIPTPYYIKATLKDGYSGNGYKPVIQYHLGLNVHPNPNKDSYSSCGVGIHISKTLKKARIFLRDAVEYYLCRPGLILGEDNEKMRCSYIWIDKLLTDKDIREIEKIEITNEEKEKRIAELGLMSEPLCGYDWLDKHFMDFTMADFNKLTITIDSGSRHTTLSSNIKKSNLRRILTTI